MRNSRRSSRSPLDRLGRLAGRRPWWVIGAVAALTLAAVPALFRLRVESDLVKMLPENDPGRATTRLVDREFGGSDMVAVVIEAGDVFGRGTLRTLDSLSAALERLPGVTGVQGLTTLKDVRGRGEDVVISRLIDSIPEDPGRGQRRCGQPDRQSCYAGLLGPHGLGCPAAGLDGARRLCSGPVLRSGTCGQAGLRAGADRARTVVCQAGAADP